MHTILFTDIEASTRLWEEHPEAMPEALARHDGIVSGAIAEAGGTVVKATGDGFLAVFDTTPAAVTASIAAQRRLQSEDWEETGPIRVRVGIHAGDVEQRGGDFFGLAMNRAARIMAAAHGGQVILSDAAATGASRALPQGAELRDMGIHRLKDLAHPEHLFQLIHPDIASEFPSLMTLDSRPHNLPLQTTEFFGRSQELQALQVILMSPSTRLLTITGPGGAGKTRVALQLAAEQIGAFRDGAFFVDLSPERDPKAVFEAIVRTLELPVAGGGDALQVLQARLRDRQMLLLLDNFEQVTAAAVGLVDLLQAAPDLKILVTSRETLRVRAERVYPMPPLALPDPRAAPTDIVSSEAVQLFVDRAQAAQPGFAVDDQNAVAVAEICLRLDGLPLAIELAAARLNVFGVNELLARLKNRLDVLGAGGRDLPDRQRTLWGAIGWSYEMLDETECDLLQVLSVFSSADLAAIEAVAGAVLGSIPIVDVLASLVDKSLVRSEWSADPQRFSMLRMIEEFAAERLAERPEREATVRNAHAAHFARVASGLQAELVETDRDRALGQLAEEIGNLRTAWRYWLGQRELEKLFELIDPLWALHDARGWYHGAIQLAEELLEALGDADASDAFLAEEVVVRTGYARALLAVEGYGPEVEDEFRRGLELSRNIDTAVDRFPLLRSLASYYMSVSDFPQAARLGAELVELGEAEHDEPLRLEGAYLYGAPTVFMGDESGYPELERVIDRYDPKNPVPSRFRLGPNTVVTARVASGLTRWDRGYLVKAVTDLEAALRVAEEIDHPYSLAYALYHNGYLSVLRGRYPDAADTARRLGEVAEANGYVVWMTLARVLEGVAETVIGEPERGLSMTEAAVDLYRGLTTPPVFWPLVLALRSMSQANAGHPERALSLIREAIRIEEAGGSGTPDLPIREADYLMAIPEPDVERAEEILTTTFHLAREGGFRLIELRAVTKLVSLRRQVGGEPTWEDALATTYSWFTEGHEEHDLVAASRLLG